MSKNKQPKKLTNTPTPPLEKRIPEYTNDSIMGFYLRAFIIALFFVFVVWYIAIYGYIDMNEAEKIAQRVNAKDQSVTSDQLKLLREAQVYNNSFDNKWFHNYKWVYHNLLNKNLKVQAQIDTFDLMERQAYKNGTDFRYLKIILEQTPEDAVILMPDAADLILPEDTPANTPKFERIKEKAWCTYFLYPRTLVFNETDGADSISGKANFRKDPDYAEKRKQITHVAIVYGRGYEHLSYQPAQREPYACLPINLTSKVTNPSNSNNMQKKETDVEENQ